MIDTQAISNNPTHILIASPTLLIIGGLVAYDKDGTVAVAQKAYRNYFLLKTGKMYF